MTAWLSPKEFVQVKEVKDVKVEEKKKKEEEEEKKEEEKTVKMMDKDVVDLVSFSDIASLFSSFLSSPS